MSREDSDTQLFPAEGKKGTSGRRTWLRPVLQRAPHRIQGKHQLSCCYVHALVEVTNPLHRYVTLSWQVLVDAQSRQLYDLSLKKATTSFVQSDAGTEAPDGRYPCFLVVCAQAR